MFNRASALPLAIIIILTILPTLTLAQYHTPRTPTNPTNPVNPGSHRYPPVDPITIMSVTPPPAGTPQNQTSTVTDFNSGRVYIIQQSGDQVIILSPSN